MPAIMLPMAKRFNGKRIKLSFSLEITIGQIRG